MSHIDQKRLLYGDTQIVRIDKCYQGKLILDIGGGGEGIIGNLYGRNVIAIDKLLTELEETNNDSIKLVMDATDLKFLSDQFDVVTAFYSFLYMKKEIIKKVISEAFRVLKNNGILEVWDTNVPSYDGGEQDIYVAKVEVLLSEEKIATGYGTKMGQDRISSAELIKMIEEQGFSIVENDESNDKYRIKAIKD